MKDDVWQVGSLVTNIEAFQKKLSVTVEWFGHGVGIL